MLWISTTEQCDARPWSLEDTAHLQAVDDVQLAPDGSRILFDVTKADLASNEYVSRYELYDTIAGSRWTIDSRLTRPRWSPQGNRIAWLRWKNGSAQLVVTDARANSILSVVRTPNSFTGYSWAPDGRAIAAVETEPETARPRIRPLLPQSDIFANAPPMRQLWIVDPATGSQRRIVKDRWSYGGLSTDGDPSWAFDGRTLLLRRQPTPLLAAFEQQQYVEVPVSSDKAPRVVLSRFYAYPFSPRPLFAPRGLSVAYAKTWDNQLASREDLYVDGKDVTVSLDLDLWSCREGDFQWKGPMLAATMLDGVSVRLFRLFADGRAPQALTSDAGSVLGFSVANTGRIAYIWSTPRRQAAIEILDPNGARREVVAPAPIPKGLSLAKTSLVRWSDGSGHTLLGQLTVPEGPVPPNTAPVIVEAHGGPQCSDDNSLQNFDAPLAQVLASHGVAYFRPNPRGSDGYGDWSYKGIVNNWGAGPMSDVMTGVDTVLGQGFGAPSRLFLEGGSYGGYLVSWIVTHSDRFNAAVAEIPATDLVLDYALGSNPLERRFYGSRPLVDPAAMRADSPVNYAASMNTPLLLISGLRDNNAPPAQTIEFYKTLVEYGKPVSMMVDEKAGHWPDDPRGNIQWWSLAIHWF